MPQPPALAFTDVAAGYDGTTVLHGLDWQVAHGAFVGIAGPSGAGKTTLVRLLTGQAERHAGRVEIAGEALGPRTRQRLGYVPQLGGVDWDFPLRVEQAVLLGRTADSARLPWFSRGERREARDLLERLGIGALARRHIRELSGGQQQRMFLARAMIRRCDILLLDEPTSGVDLATRRDILALLAELNAEGLTVVLTTHDLNWVAAQLPHVALLNGTIVREGAPGAVLTPDALLATYGAHMRVLREDGQVVVTDEAPLLAAPTDVAASG
ncbi:MAG: metal ABC transporter ATP-binding protein [Egibacteraceae bacterium]